MNILILTSEWTEGGGIQQFVSRMSKGLNDAGDKVVLIYDRPGTRPLAPHPSIHAEYCLRSLQEDRGHFPPGDKVLLDKIIRTERIDVAFAHEIANPAMLDYLADAMPMLAMVHAYGTTCLRGTKTMYATRNICQKRLGWSCYLNGCFIHLSRRGRRKKVMSRVRHVKKRLEAMKKIACIVVASTFMQAELVRHGFQEGQVVVVPPGIEPARSSVRKQAGGSVKKILFVGRIDRYKGCDVLLEALGHVTRDYQAVIVGDGPYLERCKRISRRLALGNKVTFTGWVPNAQLPDYYAGAALVVVPSLWAEPFGLVGLEAMAFAKPVVAFRVGGIPDWLEHGKTGILVRRNDKRGLASAIDRLLENEDLALAMGEHAREKARHYGQTAHIGELRRLLQKIYGPDKSRIEKQVTWQH